MAGRSGAGGGRDTDIDNDIHNDSVVDDDIENDNDNTAMISIPITIART